jgi:hypothetical protein
VPNLPKALIAQPPIELWPTVVTRVPVPADLEEIVIRPFSLPIVAGSAWWIVSALLLCASLVLTLLLLLIITLLNRGFTFYCETY